MPKWLRKNMEQVSTIEGSFVEEGNYLILTKKLTYNFTQWGDFEGRPVQITFKKQGSMNSPFNFYFPPWKDRREVNIPAAEAFSRPMAILFSGTVGQKGEGDEKGEVVVISPYDPVETISKKEEKELVQKAIAGLTPDKKELANQIIDALAYIKEEELQDTSLWKEIARKLNIEEKEVITVINSLANSPSLKSVGAGDSRDLKPFFKKHELGFKNIAAVTMAAKALKYLIIDKNEKERAIRKKIEELNESFHNSEIEIEIERQIKTGIFKCSGKEYKYAVFHFKEEKKTINVSFLEDRAALTSAELAELRIQDTEKHHLDCPGLEGVWFINSVLSQNSQNRDSDHFSDRTPDRKMVAVPILQAARIHVENLKYAPTIPEKTMLCHIIADSILPIGQRNMLKMLEQDMRGKEYSEKVVSLSGVSHDNSEEFIAALSRVKAGAEKIYREQGIERVEFVAACPNTALVSKVQSVLGIKAIAFKPSKENEVDIIQVEGIMLALRALHSGKIETLKAAF